MTLIVPMLMLGTGVLWKKHPPQKINWVYGYRTRMSMKNEDTWKFAHSFHAKIWVWVGAILFVVSLILMIVFRESYEKATAWIMFTQLALLILSIIPTEIALRKKFGIK